MVKYNFDSDLLLKAQTVKNIYFSSDQSKKRFK